MGSYMEYTCTEHTVTVVNAIYPTATGHLR